MTPLGDERTEDTGGLDLSAVTELLGGLAAVAGLIYVTGGAVLTLRLAFEHLPALGVVGQLPHGFLFSIGASQVVIPALAVAAFHVIYAAHRSTPPARRPSVWETARKKKLPRRRHLTVASIVPVLLVLPGAILALWSEPETGVVAVVVGVVAALAAIVGVVAYRHKARGIDENAGVQLVAGEPKKFGLPRYYLLVLAGGVPFVLIAVAAALLTDGDLQFLWLIAAWATCVLAVLGYLLLRGKIGDHFRADAEKKQLVRAQVMLSLAVAALAAPGLVCFWAAWPLEDAVLCTTSADSRGSTYVVDGVLVGEASDRVYVGNTATGKRSIISVPQTEVARTVIGGASTEDASCPDKPETSSSAG